MALPLTLPLTISLVIRISADSENHQLILHANVQLESYACSLPIFSLFSPRRRV